MNQLKNLSNQLYLTNSKTGKKEIFKPYDENNIKMYVCGPTVYNPPHIGNIRSAVSFDILYRVLIYIYGKECVFYARNITDVDDKIIIESKRSNKPISEITKDMTNIYRKDIESVGCLLPKYEPKATDNIENMISLIEILLYNKVAYIAEGHVIFSVDAYKNYGELSKQNQEDIIMGSRVEIAPYKKNPADFILWKPSDEFCGFSSPWGMGRPGWHIECSAMIRSIFNSCIDIHGGGGDLLFPHHENESAQSICAYGDEFVKFWLHNGFVLVNGEKMSKSLRNCYTISDLVSNSSITNSLELRYFYLTKHYRKPINYTNSAIKSAQKNLYKLSKVLIKINDTNQALYRINCNFNNNIDNFIIKNNIIDALFDDLNTSLALSHMIKLSEEIVNIIEIIIDNISNNIFSSDSDYFKSYIKLTNEYKIGLFLLGFDENNMYKIHQNKALNSSNKLILDNIEELASKRWDAKLNKDWKTADLLREEIKNLGYDICDMENSYKIIPKI
ncbi:cysteine--tRNA ligase [Lyticum sinuosum]|uniref:Cysteine--tRNA ligase n=1 Tax=Lyticum sinuosum TaxID=1332059 RepID=A0AAE4VJV8_9RICK|nr:cysteine--tRNA ligase [Lyticum sinuosum]MDZ5761271.1 Cysteine--tRNA ligase [Lyticum sinuosum]